VHQRAVGLACRQHVGNGRHGLELELDFGGHVFGFSARVRNAHGDELADVAHLALGQHGLHGRLEPRQRGVGADRGNGAEIFGDEDTVAELGGHAHIPDAGVRQRAAQEGNLLHAGELEIADILSATHEEAVLLLAEEAGADALTYAGAHAGSPASASIMPLTRLASSSWASSIRAPRGTATIRCARWASRAACSRRAASASSMPTMRKRTVAPGVSRPSAGRSAEITVAIFG